MGKSIADYGGIEVFLDGTKALHNGLGYTDFVTKYKEYKVNHKTGIVSRLVDDFNVSRPTIYNWLEEAGLVTKADITEKKDWL